MIYYIQTPPLKKIEKYLFWVLLTIRITNFLVVLFTKMSSVDRAVMLENLGWSRGGKKNNHLPDDIVNIIHQFTFFDVRSEAYRVHLFKEDVKADKLRVLDHMMSKINYGLRRCGTGEYGVEYNPINIGSNCCTVCGEFSLWDPVPENIRCSCRFLTEEEIMDLEHERQDNYFWEEEEDAERDRERRRINREFDKEFGDEYYSDYDTYSEDDPYSDRKPNWDEGSECSLDNVYDDDYY